MEERVLDGTAEVDAVSQILQTRKLFVRNLPFVTTDEEIASLMRQYGEVEDARVLRDKSTGKSKGFALVQFASPVNAVTAFEELDGQIFQGRLLHIIPGKPLGAAAVPEGEEPAAKKGGFKAERDSKRKANAHDKSAWSTFFMREDTVAQAVADLLGVSKAEMLDPEAPDAAVRMALGEAQVRSLQKGLRIVCLRAQLSHCTDRVITAAACCQALHAGHET